MKSKPQVKKVVLAYSGGLDTSVIVPWLKENYGCEVVCFCADVGQSDEDLVNLKQKAIKSGASQFVLHDMKEEFASDYLFPMLKMGAVYEHKYLLGTSIARHKSRNILLMLHTKLARMLWHMARRVKVMTRCALR